MRVFCVPEDVVVSSHRFSRRYSGITTTKDVPLDLLIIDTGGETDLVNKALEEQRKKRLGGDGDLVELSDKDTVEGASKKEGEVTLVGETALLPWAGFPTRLGRVSTRFAGKGLYMHEELEPLVAQLHSLISRFPHKQHFRIAAVASFGTNLGDSLIGMTAMRILADTLRQHLPSFVVDMLLCTSGNPANSDIVGHEPWVGDLHPIGPSVSDFARYDAYFDFTGLIGLPRITEMPIVDWFLWWGGLNPAVVSAERKRNIVNISWQAWSQVTLLLNGVTGKRVLFNPTASVPLRSFPLEKATVFVQ